jgi:molecular chaperone GrpE
MTRKNVEDDNIELEGTESEVPRRPDMGKDDIKAEESFSSTGETPIETAVSEDETDVSKLKAQIAQFEDRYLRMAAEFENYKKRNARQFEDIIQNAEGEIFRQVLEIVDNLKRALELPENQKDFDTFKSGMQMIYEQMNKFLNKHKIEAIKSVGHKFDPEMHEAVMQIESEQHPEGVVASELAGGYKRGEKVIRHAKVGVSKGKRK